MVDPQLQMMFNAMVLPTLKQMPSDALIEIREYLVAEVDKELQRRAVEAVTGGEVVT